MFNYDRVREVVVTGLSKYLGCPVERSNHNEEKLPYPFGSYTITTLMSANKGTYGVYEDGVDRKPHTQTWSLSFLSDKNSESVQLAIKAHEWLDHIGTTYLSDNGVIVQSVGGVTNRDNILSVEYEYRNGFDVVFWLMNEVGNPVEETGYIENVVIDKTDITPVNKDEIIDDLTRQLDIANVTITNNELLGQKLSERLKGGS